MQPASTALDPSLHSPRVHEIKSKLLARTIGQDQAVHKLCGILETFFAGYNDPQRPVSVVLELGPTGTGKTTLVENLCDILYGDPKAHVRVNCADFGDSHQTQRMVGAPPGYLGYNDKKADHYFTQEQLNKPHTDKLKLTIVLLDEIEKAHLDFYRYLLAIFNDGRGRVDGQTVDFTRVLFVMTSNLGASEISRSIGFSKSDLDQLNKQNEAKTDKAVRAHFSPEFLNRIDEIINFNALSEESISTILDVELIKIRRLMLMNQNVPQKYVFQVKNSARQHLIKLGFQPEYGARPLKRVLKRYITDPLASMVGSGQINHGDLVMIHIQAGGSSFSYSKYSDEDISMMADPQWDDFRRICS